jgi:hypothetical protein
MSANIVRFMPTCSLPLTVNSRGDRTDLDVAPRIASKRRTDVVMVRRIVVRGAGLAVAGRFDVARHFNEAERQAGNLEIRRILAGIRR